MENNNNKPEEQVSVDTTTTDRKEQPSMVGATFIRYGTYTTITVIVLYFIAKYLLPLLK